MTAMIAIGLTGFRFRCHGISDGRRQFLTMPVPMFEHKVLFNVVRVVLMRIRNRYHGLQGNQYKHQA